MRTLLLLLLTTTLLATLLAACSVLPAAPPKPAVYDLGPPPAASAQPAPLQLQVQPDPGLAGTAIVYRLAYQDPHRYQSYRDSQWLAPPDDLLASRLAQTLKTIGALRLQLSSFEQVFASPTQASVHLRVRATLELAGQRRQRDFDLVLEAMPDAAGAVAALARATDQLAAQLQDWLNTQT